MKRRHKLGQRIKMEQVQTGKIERKTEDEEMTI